MKIELKHSDFVALLAEGPNCGLREIPLYWWNFTLPGRDPIGSVFLHGTDFDRFREYALDPYGELCFPSSFHLSELLLNFYKVEGYRLMDETLEILRNVAIEGLPDNHRMLFNVRVVDLECGDGLAVMVSSEFTNLFTGSIA